jgi:hypothetical protein
MKFKIPSKKFQQAALLGGISFWHQYSHCAQQISLAKLNVLDIERF